MRICEINTKKKTSLTGRVLAACCLLTVVSQLPQLVELNLSSTLGRVIWIGYFLFLCFVKNDGKLSFPRELRIGIGVAFLFIIFVFTASFVRNISYYNSSLVLPFFMSIFLLLLGVQTGDIITKYDFENCCKAYVLGAVVLALNLYFSVFRGADLSGKTYLYGSKNSAAVILFTAFLIAFVYGWKKGGKIRNLLNAFVLALFVVLIFMMKTRAMIVCFPLVAFVSVIRAPFRKKLKLPLVAVCLVFVVLLANPEIYDLLVNDIILGGRGEDLNDISSGRFEQWLNFPDMIREKILFGDGATELEAFPLTALIQYGIPMGVILIFFAAYPVGFSIRRLNQHNDNASFLLLLVSLAYFADSIFEQLAPFGPGARCFFLWILFGIVISRKNTV